MPTESRNLFAAGTGAQVVEKATERATALAEVVKKQKLFSKIQGREYVRVEGWTLLGSMMGAFPVTDWCHELTEDGKVIGFEARVEVRTLEGQTIGAAIARCTRREQNWKSRDDFALESMAQTRATSKALRLPLGFIMQLAGFEATPAEEIPTDTPPAEGQGKSSGEAVASPAPAGTEKPKTAAQAKRQWKAVAESMGLSEADLQALVASRPPASGKYDAAYYEGETAFLNSLKELGAEKVAEHINAAKEDAGTKETPAA